jgi:hypothetical protein
MGIALLSIVDLFTPLQTLASRWMPARRSHHVQSSGLRYVGVRPGCTARQAAAGRTDAPAPTRPVRVVQHPGRLVISGRMAEVCAELDRLVALEAADASRHRAHLH